MRAAILSFAFDTLGAREALSGGFADNATSLNVSRSLGYERERSTELFSDAASRPR
jgi:RimJ/RimL family protein N-acetyltransferase